MLVVFIGVRTKTVGKGYVWRGEGLCLGACVHSLEHSVGKAGLNGVCGRNHLRVKDSVCVQAISKYKERKVVGMWVYMGKTCFTAFLNSSRVSNKAIKSKNNVRQPINVDPPGRAWK